MRESGQLEQLVLGVLGHDGERSVREVLDALGTDHAYTTILTVLQRLHEKGEVLRQEVGRAFVYRLAPVPREVIDARVTRLLSPHRNEPEVALMALIEGANAVDPSLVDRLEDLIHDWKRQGRRS